jgi:predicted permease
MSILRNLATGLRSLFRNEQVNQELDEELNGFLDMAVQEKMKRGLSRQDALRAVRLERGSLEVTKEVVRAAGWESLVETSWQDLRFAVRVLRKSPGFTVVALLTLTLGIGANTAIFTVVNGVLLDRLPYPHPEQLVSLAETLPPFQQFAISYPNLLDWSRMNHTFEAMAAYRQNNFNLTGSGEAQRVKATQVSATFFPLLGVKPVIGRDFSPDEDKPGGEPVVMLSEGLWRGVFGGATDILDKTVTLDGAGYRVIGVVPRTFYFCCENTNFRLGDVYLPVGAWDVPWMQDRGAHPGLFAIGRLKTGVTLEQTRAEMDAIARNLAAAYPDSDKNAGIALAPLKERMVGDVRPVLLVLFAAVSLVLVIGCVNVANLLLARSTGRAREFALRAALGATRGRTIRQLLAESALLAVAGGALGLLFAMWGTRAGLAALPEALPRANDVRMDWHVFLFTLIVSVLASLLFGLAPALQTSRADLNETLQKGERGTGVGRHRIQGAFTAIEMSLTVVLLVGAGLMIRSVAHLWNVNPGFDSHNVLTFTVALPPSTAKQTPARVRATLDQLTNTIAAVPGVTAVAITDGALPMAGDNDVGFWVEGRPKPPTQREMPNALNYIVGPDYLKAMSIPVRRGRFVTPQDDLHSPFVAVIDENFARQHFPDQDPVGKHVHLAGLDQPFEIVGVVGHVNQRGLDENESSPAAVQIYTPVAQIPDQYISLLAKAEGFVVRTQAPNYPTTAAIRHAIQANSQQVSYDFEPMERLIADSVATRRFAMTLLSAFAALAVLLASIGIYGVTSYVVSRRTHEIGIRLALGAERRDILRMVLAQGAKLAFVGVGLGLCAAFALTRLMVSLLFGVTPRDPLTFVAVALLLVAVALAACYIPARRATHLDPLLALRYE